MNLSDYPTELATLLTPRLMELGPGSPNVAIRDAISQLRLSAECMAGLWLYHDFLDESHRISQDLPTKTGSYWHAVMHRREPDAWNSKYWWRQVGSHPVLDQLRKEAPALGYDFTTPDAFVDFCERVRDTETPDAELAKRVQLLEWQLLFEYCFTQSGGYSTRL